MIKELPRWLPVVALLIPAVFAHAQTDPLPAETRLVALSTAPAATEEDFTIAASQDLVVTLTDLQVPAALSTATVVVTQGGSMVGNATLAAPAASATLSIAGAVGPYTLRVFGAPNGSFSVGTFTVCVAPKASASNCIQSASIAGNISAPSSAADPTVSTVSQNLTVLTTGKYEVTFADDLFPAALNTVPNLALFQGSAVVSLGIQSGAIVDLSPGTYTLLAIAQADQTVKAGLYGIAITGPAGVAPLLNATFPVGLLSAPAQRNNPSAQSVTLKVTDFAFPAPLAGASALLTAGATNLGTASAAVGPLSVAAPAGPLQVWNFATAAAAAGTYEVDLTSSTASLLQAAYGVGTGSSLAFAFVTAALNAGSYQANAADFQFPAALQSLQFAVAQNGTILGKAAAAGALNFTAAAGPVVLLADATTPTNGNGLFDVNVQTGGASPQLVFDKTQGVSAANLFDTQTINLGASGNFDVALTDLMFPAQFQNLALVVSSGGAVLGKIYGGGPFSFAATPGAYQLTFIATPAPQQQYGLYAVQIVNSAPTVTLKASPTTVVAGGATTLTWTTTNAVACTGSGGTFTGTETTGSGTASVVVAATTTYKLTCTGPGGSEAQSVTVTATASAPSSSHSGGGGGVDLALLSGLGLLALVRLRSMSYRATPECALNSRSSRFLA
jgi:hypothetical protein